MYLFVDEGTTIHETVGYALRDLLGTSGVLFFAWVIPATVILAIFATIYLKFLVHLPGRIRLLVVIAGALFVGGALGIELLRGTTTLCSGDNL